MPVKEDHSCQCEVKAATCCPQRAAPSADLQQQLAFFKQGTVVRGSGESETSWSHSPPKDEVFDGVFRRFCGVRV